MSIRRFSLLIIIFSGLLCIPGQGLGLASASEREIELFSKGYEHLLSCRPDSAAGTFRMFLKEFPKSSVRDAALFWLGKTLISMKLFSEAELNFQTIQEEFPDSPFIGFIAAEREEIAKVRSTGSATGGTMKPDPEKDIIKKGVKDEKSSGGTDAALTQLLAEKEKVESLLQEERRKTTELMSQLMELKTKQDRSHVLPNTPSGTQLDPDAIVRIGNRDYPLAQIIAYQVSASMLFSRFGINDIVWRTGNPLDDFIAEELLFSEARKAHITIDTNKQREMAESRKLSAAEEDYFGKFLTIARYIDSLYADGPTEKWIELISVDYKPGDAATKTVVAADLQKAAREGKSFEEIAKSNPGGAKFSRLSIQDFNTKYREKSQLIQKLNFLNEETVIIWSEKGYMLIKPILSRTHFNPFEELTAQKKEKLKTFLKQWLADHRK